MSCSMDRSNLWMSWLVWGSTNIPSATLRGPCHFGSRYTAGVFYFLVLLEKPAQPLQSPPYAGRVSGNFGCGSHSKQRGKHPPIKSRRRNLAVTKFMYNASWCFEFLYCYLPLVLAVYLISSSPPPTRYDLAIDELTVLERNLIDGLLHSLLAY